jgi:ParB-like chromosome segregation protein Spo0J
MADDAGPKRDLFEALASAGVQAGPAVGAIAGELRARVAGLLRRAQAAGAVRGDIGGAELTALLSGVLFAVQNRPGADRSLLLAVIRDGLRPRP